MTDIIYFFKKNFKYFLLINFIFISLSIYFFFNSINNYKINYTVNESDIDINLSLGNKFLILGSEEPIEGIHIIDNLGFDTLNSLLLERSNWDNQNYDKEFIDNIYRSHYLQLKNKKISESSISIDTSNPIMAHKYMEELNKNLSIKYQVTTIDTQIKIFQDKINLINSSLNNYYETSLNEILANALELEKLTQTFDDNYKEIPETQSEIIHTDIELGDFLNLNISGLIQSYYLYDKKILLKYKELIERFFRLDYENQILYLQTKDPIKMLNRSINSYKAIIKNFNEQSFDDKMDLFQSDRSSTTINGYSNVHKSFIVFMFGFFFSFLFLCIRYIIESKNLK